ncbi:Rrf2 family transcriptional regulator [Klebsiella sp. BIGb0407]|uniref:Rrf2 family transcriptional regulator n=1 Tax=Klebsiella sp. BIGb0407 TaxID=2940603 RepID=UPI0021694205|nr:Rrf2 family transcriptional regulator [Klebsiella sp. BIGb0407]MCS3429825.1 Rrf2 family nitric oxide-sensitive transcriptional repressor [Klebsiella sp. BIGb0407]
MKLHQFTDLGLRTLIFLTQPARATPFTISQTASELQVSVNHLVKVVHFMGQQGWIHTVRGRNGGIYLAKDLNEYRLGEIIQTLEERADDSKHIVNCSSPVCPLINHCNLNGMLQGAMQVFISHLNQYTLADAVRNRQSLMELMRIPLTEA